MTMQLKTIYEDKIDVIPQVFFIPETFSTYNNYAADDFENI